MKISLPVPVSVVVLATSILTTLACGGSDGTGPTTRVPVASVAVSPDTARIERGNTIQLMATVLTDSRTC